MNCQDQKYARFALVREMMETPAIVGAFDFDAADDVAASIRDAGKLFLTGEGSSRIFPAKNLICEVLRLGVPLSVATEGARQAHAYDLSEFAVFGASNSGKTKELISLFTRLGKRGHKKRFGLTANSPCMLESVASRCYTLRCGKEDAVAATKSVVEQALFYRSLLRPWEKDSPMAANRLRAERKAKEVLETELDPVLVQKIAQAPTIYLAGRNNGVAEELTLKTNEITHKKSDYLEGTYAVHGVEEVMKPEDVVLVIDPFPEEIEKFKKTLVDGVGMTVIAVAEEETALPTIQIPRVEGFQTVLQTAGRLEHLGSSGHLAGDRPRQGPTGSQDRQRVCRSVMPPVAKQCVCHLIRYALSRRGVRRLAATITYTRRRRGGITSSSNPAELFGDWKGSAESWMFVSPHDDDVVLGSALMCQVGLAEGAQVHAVIVTDGQMGYCSIEQRPNIAKIRKAEAEKSYRVLGLKPDGLRFIGCPDCNLNAYRGRHFTTNGDPTAIEGAGGMQNALTHALRQIRPTRVFLPTGADLHPDHRIVYEEALVSLFHAQGNIWPELGDPIVEIPKVYEFAVYCDFPEAPQIRLETPPAMLETKLRAIRAFASQEQIGTLIDAQRTAGPIEYFREVGFRIYSPKAYHLLFAKGA